MDMEKELVVSNFLDSCWVLKADIRRYAIENSWISSSSEYMTEAYSQMTTRNLTGNIQIQPINDFRIDVSFTKIT